MIDARTRGRIGRLDFALMMQFSMTMPLLGLPSEA